jgi:hypothetical protein
VFTIDFHSEWLHLGVILLPNVALLFRNRVLRVKKILDFGIVLTEASDRISKIDKSASQNRSLLPSSIADASFKSMFRAKAEIFAMWRFESPILFSMSFCVSSENEPSRNGEMSAC